VIPFVPDASKQLRPLEMKPSFQGLRESTFATRPSWKDSSNGIVETNGGWKKGQVGSFYTQPEPRVNAPFQLGDCDSRHSVKQMDAGRRLRAVDIDWVWIVEARRRAAPDEIRKLCKLVHER
jgi:hypothetical protein